MAAITICSDFRAPQNKISHCFPIYLLWSDRTRCHDLTFSLSSFTFIKRLFSSSSLSAIRVVSSIYLKLLIFFLAILIPAWASSSPTFHMMYCAYNLNKQSSFLEQAKPTCGSGIASNMWTAWKGAWGGILCWWRCSLSWRGFGVIQVQTFIKTKQIYLFRRM